MTHSSQFQPLAHAATADTPIAAVTPSAQPKEQPKQTVALSSAPLQFQPHTKPQSCVAGWAWAVFMTSVVLFLGSTFFASYTKTAPIPNLPVGFSLR